jgi:hypothetical protein
MPVKRQSEERIEMDDFERFVRERHELQRDMPRIVALMNEGIDRLAQAITTTMEPYLNLGVIFSPSQVEFKHSVYGELSLRSLNITFAGPIPLGLIIYPSATLTGKLGVFEMHRAGASTPYYVIQPNESERHNVWKWRLSKRFDVTLLNDEEEFTEEAFKKAAYDLLTM